MSEINPTVFASFEDITKSKCVSCKKITPIIIIAQYTYNNDEIVFTLLCKKCFKKDFPNYTLEKSCIVCGNNFNCSVQDIIFSKKEIAKFKKIFFK